MSNIKERLKSLVQGMEDQHVFKLESAILKFTDMLWRRMDAIGVTPTELAKRIDAKPPYVSKILRGNSNFTFDSIIKISTALDTEFVFDLIPKSANSKWVTKPVDASEEKSCIVYVSQESMRYSGTYQSRILLGSATIQGIA